MRAVLATLVLATFASIGCSKPQPDNTCANFATDVARPTKVASNGECYVQCPEPVGWISDYMWFKRGGCAPHAGLE